MKRFLILFALSFLQISLYASSQLSAVIQGQVLNAKSKYINLQFQNSPLDDTLQTIQIELNEKGQFYHELPIVRALEAFIFNTTIYLEPEENLELVFDYNTKKLVRYNSKYDNMNYLEGFKLMFQSEKENRKKHIINDSEAEYIKFEDELAKAKVRYLESFIEKHKLSITFVARQNAIYKYTAINNKYEYANNYQFYTQKKKKLSDNYYDFMKINVFSEENLISVPDVYRFAMNYYRYMLNENAKPMNSNEELMDYEFFTANNIFTGRVKNVILTKVFLNILDTYPFTSAKRFISIYMSNVYVEEYRKLVDKKIAEVSVATYKSPAYDFELQDQNGKPVKLSDFKGKKVYLNFWASWCKPCLEEIENHNLIQEKMNEDLITIMVSVDTDLNAWKKVLNKYRPAIVQLNMSGMNNVVGKNYNLKNIPKSLLINIDGIIIQEDVPVPSNPKIFEYLKVN